jgi:uncharacterized protein YdeI (YjbR/CyaY-like superfamily)
MDTKNGLPVRPFETSDAMDAWLDEHWRQDDGFWLKLAKKNTDHPSVTYPEAVDLGLVHGWIDSQKASWDDEWWLQRFTPRRGRSKWSMVNRRRVEELLEEGRMKAGGLAAVEAARDNGEWERAYPSASQATVPGDLEKRLAASPKARETFENLSGGNRYAVLIRLHDARTAETRQRRLDTFMEKLEAGKREMV